MRTKTFLGFASPSLIMMVGLTAVPFFLAIWLSFHRLTFRGEWIWAGLDTYEFVLEDPDFYRALGFTLIFCAVTIPMKILVGFLTALALERVHPVLRAVFIACALLPFIVTPVVGTLAFSWLFRDFGVVTYWMKELGITVHWWANEQNSRALVMLHYIWHGTPFATVVLYAGLQGVPRDEIEAAIVDGASFWYRLRAVILPHLKSLIMFLALMMIMDGYRVFDSIAILTKGLNGTESLMYYNYRVAIQDAKLASGYAIAILTVFGILLLLIPFLVNTYREQREIR